MHRITATLALVGALLLTASPAQATSTVPPQFTLMMGRGIQAQSLNKDCTRLAPGPDLTATATFLQGYGLRATVPATLSQTSDTATPVCTGGLLYPTWDQLRALRDTYGWDVVPRGPTNDTITSLSGQDLYDATCGLLPKFYDEGFPTAWGLYAFPQNRFTPADQQEVASCYAFSRRYTGLNSTNSMLMAAPYVMKTISVNGGLCNDPSQACYKDPLVRNQRRYMTPAQLDASVSTANGRWTNVQFYRLVTGSQGTQTSTAGWDCTSPDPSQHWSHLPEQYCYQDFQAFIQGLPAGATNSNPAEVATLYGRTMAP